MKTLIRLVALFVLMAGFALPLGRADEPLASKKEKPFGLDKVIAFYGDFRERVPSQNFNATGEVWFGLLQSTVDKGSDILAKRSSEPFAIDELGFDYDGPTDLQTIEVLKAAKEKKPDLQIAVWQMGGPVAPKLAAAYSELVELVMMETYVELGNSWMIVFKLQAARLNGLLDKSVIGLGIGKGPRGAPWTQTTEELEQQLQLIRFVAPESPGVAFFGQWTVDDYPITAEDIEELCSGFLEIPTDGSGLKPELRKLGQTFTRRYRRPALFCSPLFVNPEYYPGDPDTHWSGLTALEPVTLRVPIMNLGERDAKDVIVRLRDEGEDGEVWAKGIVDVPARSIAIAVLPVPPAHERPEEGRRAIRARAVKSSMEVEAPGCRVSVFLDERREE